MKTRNRFSVLIASAMFAFATMAQATEGVSPGETDRFSVLNNPCPTFSWQDDDAATIYEIVAYSLHTDESSAAAELTAEAEVLYSQVPAGATSWTPSADRCFAPGGRYVWFVRAVTELADVQVIEAGEWSAGRYFTVPAGPSPEDVARAVEILRKWEAANGGGTPTLSSAAVTATAVAADADADPDAVAAPVSGSGSGSGGGAGANRRKSVPTASAAIRGVNPEYDLEAYGVVGISNSVWGAGVAAANTEGGPDLLLDGSYDGGVSTAISEWGIARSAPTDQVLYVRNYGGGAITFDVLGTFRGTGLECPGCVGESDLAEESVTSIAIEDSGITEEDIAMGAVFSHHIYDGTIQAQDLSSDAVDGNTIVDGSVTADDLADGAVTPSKIQLSAVHTDKLHDGAVTEDKIAPGAVLGAHVAFETIDEQHIADDAITHSKIANGAIDTNHLPDNVITSAKIADGTIIAADLADDSVTGGKIVDGAVDVNALRNGAVTSTKIFDGAVTSADLQDGAVISSKIADGAVTSAKIGLGAVTEANLFPQAVTSNKIADHSVVASKLATGSVTSVKIADGSLTDADVDPTGGIIARTSSFYENDLILSLPAGSAECISASCNDANDLPLTFSCFARNFLGVMVPDLPVHIRGFNSNNWEYATHVAEATCCFENADITSHSVKVEILCIEVAGP